MANGKNSYKCSFCGSFNSLDAIKVLNGSKKVNYGALYYNLTVSESRPFPKNLYGIKATLKEKEKALIMLDKILTDFNISHWDLQKWRQQMLETETFNLDELDKQAGFTRDAEGKITSPFPLKKLK